MWPRQVPDLGELVISYEKKTMDIMQVLGTDMYMHMHMDIHTLRHTTQSVQ